MKIFLGGSRRRIGLFGIVAGLIVIIDQWSKSWIRANPQPKELLPGLLNLSYSQNYGAIFGLPVNQTFLTSISLLIIVTIIFLLFRYLSLANTLSLACLGLIFGGALGNLIDRLRFSGYVTDFIDVHLMELFHWYTFNLADAAITIGIFTFVYSLYRAYEQKLKVQDHQV